jgi:hypothetical protein
MLEEVELFLDIHDPQESIFELELEVFLFPNSSGIEPLLLE